MPRKARALVELDRQIEAEIDRQVSIIDNVMAKMRSELDGHRLEAEARRLKGDPSFHDMPVKTVIAMLRAAHRAETALTKAARRRAKIEELSLRGHSVAQIAERVGLSYYYVVQVRRSLGVSSKRERR